MGVSKAETIRRLLIGELQRVNRGRYGPTLPDDDAGRDDLELMLIHAAPDKRTNMLAVWAPWMTAAEADATLAKLPCTRPNVAAIGERIRLTNAEREACGVRLIQPIDMTKAELAERKKAKKRDRDRERRRKAGALPRSVYEATSKTKLKPWEAEGISRRTWYRRNGTGTSPRSTRVLGEPRTCAKRHGRDAKKKNNLYRQHKSGNGRATRGPP